MTSKKCFQSTFSYMELYKRCPKDQLVQLQQMHQKQKEYLDKVNSLPEHPPKIDFEYYKERVRTEYIPLVEEFESKYKEYCVPYPEDPYVCELEKLEEEVKNELQCYKEESNKRIECYEKEIARIKSNIPFEIMTWEEYCHLYPDKAPDFINNPTFWPHTPEEQISQNNNDHEIEIEINKKKE